MFSIIYLDYLFQRFSHISILGMVTAYGQVQASSIWTELNIYIK